MYCKLSLRNYRRWTSHIWFVIPTFLKSRTCVYARYWCGFFWRSTWSNNRLLSEKVWNYICSRYPHSRYATRKNGCQKRGTFPGLEISGWKRKISATWKCNCFCNNLISEQRDRWDTKRIFWFSIWKYIVYCYKSRRDSK